MAFNVAIYKEQWNCGLRITIWEERNGRIFVAQPMDLMFTETSEGVTTRPTLQFDHFTGPALLKAFAEALDQNGVKTDSDARLLGTIEAKNKHLEDLRHLLKLPKNSLTSK